MTQRTPIEIMRDLLAAGFDRSQAIIMTAIGLAESGGNDTAIGDTNLQTSTWGPSVGIFQVRTLKQKTGTGDDRDLAALMGDSARQATAAWDISHKGTDYTPWSVYTSGKYQQYLSAAQNAAAQLSDTGMTPVVDDPFGNSWDWLTPSVPAIPGTDAVTGAVGSAIQSLIKPFRNIGIELAFAGLGAALIIVGFNQAFSPAARAARAAGGAVRTVTGGG